MSINPVPPTPVTPATPATPATPTSNAVTLATLKSNAQAFAATLVNELSEKIGTDLPKAQAALDAWIAKL